MSYNFLKDEIKKTISSYSASIEMLENFLTFKDNNYILKHNIDSLFQILKFLNSSENIFILNGFMGSGKTVVCENIVNFISDEVLIFKNSYQEAINLDDVFLSMFKDFSMYHNEKKVILPKFDSSVFSEKINTYIKYCNVPMLFIFDSFEINMRSQDTQKDILDFLNFLSKFEKIKIIICSRTFRQEDLLSSESSMSYSLKAFSKEEMDEYLEQNNITGNKYEVDELYKLSRGHYLLLELSVLIMSLLDISLEVFASEYKKSSKNFLEFLISKILSVSSEKFTKFLVFLTAVRHGISKDFLIKHNIANEDDILFLIQKHVVSEKYGKYYLKDYIKNETNKIINAETRINVHRYLINLYENELPLKPFDRELFLSRLTMRQEIAYHSERANIISQDYLKNSKVQFSDVKDFNYIKYSGLKNNNVKEKKENKPSNEKRYYGKIKKIAPKTVLSDSDSLLLNMSSKDDDITKEFYSISSTKKEDSTIIETTENIPDSLNDYLEIAQNYEDAFNFSSAILYYKKALTYTNDDLFKEKEPVIYTKLAICHKKIQDLDETVRFYEKAYEIYAKTSLPKANEILLVIAKIYSEVYKFEKAKEIYNRVLYSSNNVDNEVKIRVYLEMAELEDNNSDSMASLKYIKIALSEAEKLSDIKLLSECYFKYALFADDAKQTDIALKYYLRCTQISNDPSVNFYLSSAYTNLAEISLENNNKTSAKMYYELAIEADKKTNNNEGLYYSYSKLALLYKGTSSEKEYELLYNALQVAKKFDDITYSVNTYFDLGDYYTENGDYKKALKSYILAGNLAPKHSYDELNQKVNNKVNKIKIILGEIEFNSILDEIKKKK